MKIAVDAMGGDYAPHAVVEGAVLALRKIDCTIILVGDREVLEPLLARHSHAADRVSIKHTSEVVRMDESPRKALNVKQDTSIRKTFDLVKSGEADAAMSAGNSGAAMLAGLHVLGTLPHVDRPCIGSILPTTNGRVVMLDAGANVDCRPHNLVQFAFMGHALAKYTLGIQSPRIGLLSIGEEAGKGNDLVRATYKLLRKSDLNFQGNIEGRDIFADNVDVVVCDGFVGNVALKTAEGVVQALGTRLKDEIRSSIFGRFGYLFMRPALKRFKQRFDYAEYGGALLLGIDGIGVIAHGRSNPVAIMNAIRISDEYARIRIAQRVKEEVESSAELKQSFGDKVHQVFEHIKEKKFEMDTKESTASEKGD
ncbi:MAG: phosphate acyltransferase PlsX [bacterium]|nr:MAG: phosphate acyltransferase PlsX [bacterium]